jgi:hypothetical protein
MFERALLLLCFLLVIAYGSTFRVENDFLSEEYRGSLGFRAPRNSPVHMRHVRHPAVSRERSFVHYLSPVTTVDTANLANHGIGVDLRRNESLVAIRRTFESFYSIKRDYSLGRSRLMFEHLWLKAKFIDEEGIDVGGITRDFLTLAAKALSKLPLFEIYNGYLNFRRMDEDAQIEHVNDAKVLGFLLGLFMKPHRIHHATFPVPISPLLFKFLRNEQFTLKDLKVEDRMLFHSIDSVKHFPIELLEEIYADDANTSEEWVQKQVDRLLFQDRKNLLIAMRDVFNLVIYPFKPTEIVSDLMISIIQPQKEIDVEQWRNGTVYRYCKDESKEIEMFWRYVTNLNSTMKSELLYRITSSYYPSQLGFASLKFIIECRSNLNTHPVAHTCSNTIDLPYYTDEEIFTEKFNDFLAQPANFDE